MQRQVSWFEKKRKKGVTLVDMLVAVSILAILMAVVLYAVRPRSTILIAWDARRTSQSEKLTHALQQYQIDAGGFPHAADILEGESNGKPICRYGVSHGTDGCVNIDDLVPAHIEELTPDPVEACSSYLGFTFYTRVNGRFAGITPTHMGKLPGDEAPGCGEGGTGGGGGGSSSSSSSPLSWTFERITLGNNQSFRPISTPDVAYIVFDADASDIVAGDTNAYRDVFVYNRSEETFTLVSRSTEGGQGNQHSYVGLISDDGRYVAFTSDATNLTSPSNGYRAMFRRDRDTDVDGIFDEAAAVSTVGTSTVNGDPTQFGNGMAGLMTTSGISADGRYVVFDSSATNLVSGDANGVYDVFVHDHQTNATTILSVDANGIQGNANSTRPVISSDGRYVAFESAATNLVSGDTNARTDVFLHDRDSDNDGVFDEAGAIAVTRVSIPSGGGEGNNNSTEAVLSSNGRYVLFLSAATNLVSGDANARTDIFLRDTQSGTTERVNISTEGNEANNTSFNSFRMTNNGRYVVFSSLASNLVAADTNAKPDIFLRDRVNSTTVRVTENAGVEGTGAAYSPYITPSGSHIVFASYDTNLVPGDTNSWMDIFLVTLSGG